MWGRGRMQGDVGRGGGVAGVWQGGRRGLVRVWQEVGRDGRRGKVEAGGWAR